MLGRSSNVKHVCSNKLDWSTVAVGRQETRGDQQEVYSNLGCLEYFLF